MLDPINEEDNKWYKRKSGLLVPRNQLGVEGKKIFFAKEISWLIENLTTVLLFNSLLGTVWQLIELSMINISYIRFFSLSQIPVDGALISFVFFLIYSIGRLIKKFVLHTLEAKMERYTQPETLAKIMENIDCTIKRGVINLIIVILLEIGLAIFFINNIFASGPLFTIFLLGFFVLGTGLIVSDIIVHYCIKLYSNNPSAANIENTVRTALENYKNYIAGFAIASIVVVVLLFLLLLKSISDNFILPVNLYNTEKMENIIYSDFKTTTYDIEYMNDQYIFVSLCTIESCDHEIDKKIVIYPTETVLFE